MGERSKLLDFLGWQNEFNAPWCAEWAAEMTRVLTRIDNNYITVVWGQWNGDGLQHNFMIIKSRGHQTQFLPKVDPVILLFDPWRDLLPRVYRPKSGRFLGPTNTFP